MGNLHFRVSASQKQIPCWIRIQGADGLSHVPFGRNSHPPTNDLGDVGGHWVATDGVWTSESGSFEISLSQGIYQVSILASPWADPIHQEVSILERQLSTRLKIDLPTGPPSDWVSGDLRVHGISPKVALVEAEGSGISIVQIQSGYRWPLESAPPVYHELIEFTGFQPALASERTVVAVNTLNRHPVAGSVSLLHAHRPTYPWGWGWESKEPDWEKDWTIADWCRQCHRIKGVVVWPELATGNPDYEVVAGLVLGDVDVIELSGSLGLPVDHENSRLPLVYSLFDHGILPGLGGASGKCSNRTRVGEKYTWVQITDGQGEFQSNEAGLDRWMFGLKKGPTIASSGPWFDFQMVEGDPERGSSSKFQIHVLNSANDARLELVGQRGVFWSSPVRKSNRMQTVCGAFPLVSSAWFALRVVDEASGGLLAHGSPRKVPQGWRSPGNFARDNRVKVLLDSGIEWLRLGQAGYFSLQISEYLEKARDKLGKTSSS